MIPSGLQRGPRRREGFPPSMLMAAAAGAVALALLAWILLSLSEPPVTTPVVAEVPVKL